MDGQNKEIYLDDKKIIDIFKDYLTSKTYNHAILLDGTWGSGKTHFIKKSLMPAVEEDEKVKRSAICVSLYGIKTTEELQNFLYMTIVTNRMNGVNVKLGSPISSKLPFEKVFDTVSKIAQTATRAVGVEANIPDIVAPWLDFNKHYFIFDDLERCPMPINETFGFINHFVEQNDAKVLIVANESEVCISQNIDRDLFKMYIATQDAIKWPKKNERSSVGRIDKKPYPDIDDIKERATLLVDEEEEYKRIKEKLVGMTIVYKPAIEVIIPNIFAKYLGNELCTNLSNALIKRIHQVMSDENHQNLRTLQSSLTFYSKVYDKLPHVDALTMETILEAVLRVSIGYRDTGYIYEIADGKDFGKIAPRGKNHWLFTSRYFVAFRFVLDYIYSGSCNLEEVPVVIKRYCEAVQSKTTLDNLCHNLYEMEDCEIINNLQDLKSELEKGSYLSEYRNVLIALFNLKRAGFEICIDEYVKIMGDKIEAGVVRMLDGFGSGEQLHNDKDFFEDYTKIVNELKKLTTQTQHKHNAQTLCEILDKESGWSEDFEAYVIQNYKGSGNFEEFRHELLTQGVPEKFKAAIERGLTKECYTPILFLRDMFQSDRRHPDDSKRYFAEYKKEITEFHTLLEFQPNSKMKRELIRYLREDLEQVLAHITTEEEGDSQ